MRILISFILSLVIISNSVFAATSFADRLEFGMEQYKKGHSKVCLSVMKKLAKEDPVDPYVNYYMAIAYVKLGDVEKAKHFYEKVIMLNNDPTLVSYSRQGLSNIKIATKEEPHDKKLIAKIDKPANPPKSKFFKKKVNTNVEEKTTNKSNEPTDEEIAKAIKVLKRAGLLNVNVGINNKANPMMTPQNNEMMQMNMLFGSMNGGGSKNKGMDIMPLLMMQAQNPEGKKNLSPEIMQVMMNNMMLDGMTSFDMKDK